MILGVSASTAELVQRLHARAAQMVADLVAARSAGRRDWYSASTLWPDMFTGGGDGE